MKGLMKTALAVLALLLIPMIAQATFIDYGFQRITSNNAENVAGQFRLRIYDATQANAAFGGLGLTGNQVLFTYTNTAAIASNITEIYVDDGTIGSLSSLHNSLGGFTNFNPAPPLNPGNLPSGNNVDPDFVATEAFSADTASGPPANGINEAADILGIVYNTSGGLTGVDDDIADGSIRVGLHVRSIGAAAESDSFINTGGPTIIEDPIPEPSTIILLGFGLLSLVGITVRRKMKK
jgi:hypothetical protein